MEGWPLNMAWLSHMWAHNSSDSLQDPHKIMRVKNPRTKGGKGPEELTRVDGCGGMVTFL